jgi:hypothetical protein
VADGGKSNRVASGRRLPKSYRQSFGIANSISHTTNQSDDKSISSHEAASLVRGRVHVDVVRWTRGRWPLAVSCELTADERTQLVQALCG